MYLICTIETTHRAYMPLKKHEIDRHDTWISHKLYLIFLEEKGPQPRLHFTETKPNHSSVILHGRSRQQAQAPMPIPANANANSIKWKQKPSDRVIWYNSTHYNFETISQPWAILLQRGFLCIFRQTSYGGLPVWRFSVFYSKFAAEEIFSQEAVFLNRDPATSSEVCSWPATRKMQWFPLDRPLRACYRNASQNHLQNSPGTYVKAEAIPIFPKSPASLLHVKDLYLSAFCY